MSISNLIGNVKYLIPNPKSKSFNKKRILRHFFILFFFLFSQRFSLDKIVATIDSDIITLRELKTSYLLHICSNKGKNPEAVINCLNELIDFSIIQKEIAGREEISEEDYIEEEERIISELGGLDKVLNVLNHLDMSWEEFREILSRRIISKKKVENLFYSRVSVSFDEIEEYYKNRYLPVTERLAIPPRSLVEMTSSIEKEIAKEKTKNILDEWIKERKSFHEINILINDKDISGILSSLE